MAQFGVPISDEQSTSITGTFADIDETSPSDSDFLYSADNTNTIYECGLTSTLGDPGVNTGHVIRYRIAKTDGGVVSGTGSDATVDVYLYEGATLRATDSTNNTITGDGTWTLYEYTLSGTEADAITDYTNLRLYFDITGGGGSPANRRGIGISWAQLEIPNEAVGTAGAYHIRKNTDDTTEIPDAGSHITAKYGTEVAVREGGVITYNSTTGVFTCTETGKYLVIYSDQYGTTSTTSTQPLSVRSRIAINGTTTDYATSIGYIAKQSGSQEYINHSAAILQLNANDTIEIELDRTDSTTSASERPDRIADRSGITILRLEDSWEYGRYRKTSTQILTSGGNSITAIDWNTIDEEDTNFTLVGGAGNSDVDMATTDVVLAIGNIIFSGGTGSINFQTAMQYRGGANPGGFQDDNFYDNVNGCSEGALTCINIFTPAAVNGDYAIDAVSRSSVGIITCATGSSMQMLKLPSTAAIFNLTDASTTENINQAGADFNFPSASEVTVDSGSFSHATNADEIKIERTSDYLLFSNARQGGGYSTGAYAVPATSFRKTYGGVDSKSQWDVHGASSFNRGTTNLDHASICVSAYIPGIQREEYITVYADRIGTNSDTMTLGTLSFRGIDMGELFGDPTISHRDEVAVTGLSHIDGLAKASIDSVDGATF